MEMHFRLNDLVDWLLKHSGSIEMIIIEEVGLADGQWD